MALPFSPHAPPLPKAFVWNRTALKARLRKAQLYIRALTNQQEEKRQALMPSEKWVAVYGRLQSPKVFRAPMQTSAGFHPRNGYGANGSVTAALLAQERAKYDFDEPDTRDR
jgi:hypothetical protein